MTLRLGTPSTRDPAILRLAEQQSAMLYYTTPTRYNVALLGADPNGGDDSTSAIKRVVAEGGTGAEIHYPEGVYRVEETISTSSGQHHVGTGAYKGVGPTATSRIQAALSGGAGDALFEPGVNNRFSNLILTGEGKAVDRIAIKTTSTVDLDWVALTNWYRALQLGDGFYYSFAHCQWRHCTYGVTDTDGNQDIRNPAFIDCRADATDFFFDSDTSSVQNARVFGGSIEGYIRAWRMASSGGSDASFFGTYFETHNVADTTHSATGLKHPVGIQPGNNSALRLYSIIVDMSNHDRFLNLSSATDVTLVVDAPRISHTDDAGGFTDPASPAFLVMPTSAKELQIRAPRWDVGSNAEFVLGGIGAGAAWEERDNFEIDYPGNPHRRLNKALTQQPRTAAPATPLEGSIYVADGATWDPAARGSGPYPVFYDGSSYHSMI